MATIHSISTLPAISEAAKAATVGHALSHVLLTSTEREMDSVQILGFKMLQELRRRGLLIVGGVR